MGDHSLAGFDQTELIAEIELPPVWEFSCPDWWDRLKAGKLPTRDFPQINKAAADRAVAAFNNLCLPDVAGLPLLGEKGGEWQRQICRILFGSLVDGVRMVPEALVMVPKKNSKTTGAAAISLVAMILNDRPRAEFLYTAATKEIADTAFSQAEGMINADPYLKARFHVRGHVKEIVDRTNRAKLKIKTFSMNVMTGVKPVFVLLDELHLMSAIAGAERVIGQIRGGLMVNPESMLVMITTQSDVVPAGAFKAELDTARGIRDGVIENGRMLPVLYEFPEFIQTDEKQPWLDPKLWHHVTPNNGKSISIPRLYADFLDAKRKGEGELRRWASQHLNIEVGLGLHAQRWRGADYWERASVPILRDRAELYRQCDVAVVGIDGGGLDDLFGLTILGRHAQTQQWMAWSCAWVHAEVLRDRPQIAPRLLDFETEQTLTIIRDDDSPMRDVHEAASIIAEVRDIGLLPDQNAVGLDTAMLAEIVDALAAVGIEGDMLNGITQGFRMQGAIFGAERKLKDRSLVHDGSALMRWCVGNAKAVQKGNATMITKEVAGRAKIDPLMSLFNAVTLMSKNPQAAVMPRISMV